MVASIPMDSSEVAARRRRHSLELLNWVLVPLGLHPQQPSPHPSSHDEVGAEPDMTSRRRCGLCSRPCKMGRGWPSIGCMFLHWLICSELTGHRRTRLAAGPLQGDDAVPVGRGDGAKWTADGVVRVASDTPIPDRLWSE